MISIYVNHYMALDARRQAEIDECLRRNFDNPLVDRFIILAQSKPAERTGLESPKAVWLELDCSAKSGQRPSFRDFFDCINRQTTSPDEIHVVAHSDVYFDDSLGLLSGLDLENVCLALTRWDLQKDGAFRPHLWDTSQDAWIFQGRVRPLGDVDFPIGVPGADGRLIWELRHADYKVVNPSFDIKVLHLHASGVRSTATEIGPPREDVWRCHLKSAALPTKNPSTTGLIAMSLFGQQEKYLYGALQNARIARHIYTRLDAALLR